MLEMREVGLEEQVANATVELEGLSAAVIVYEDIRR